MLNNANIDLVCSFIQIEGQLKIQGIDYNYDHNGGVRFSGHKRDKRCNIVMDKNQVELISECQGVIEVYECYKEMEYY